jgi:hypothetical protein
MVAGIPYAALINVAISQNNEGDHVVAFGFKLD